MGDFSSAPVSATMGRDEHPHTMETIELTHSPLAICCGLLVCPATVLMSWWVLEPRTEALVLHFGQLTEKHESPGWCVFSLCALLD